MKTIIYLIIAITIISLVYYNKTKEHMCNIERPVCDYYCQRAKYEVCLVKGNTNCDLYKQ